MIRKSSDHDKAYRQMTKGEGKWPVPLRGHAERRRVTTVRQPVVQTGEAANLGRQSDPQGAGRVDCGEGGWPLFRFFLVVTQSAHV